MASTENEKRNNERVVMHNAIWGIAEELRGSVDGWDFKQYILGFLFYRFISENLIKYINKIQRESGEPDFNYLNYPDEKAELGKKTLVEEKGFFILPSELFQNVVRRAPNDSNLNETLNKIFRNIEGSSVGSPSQENFRGLFGDLDVNHPKLGETVKKRNDRLTKILQAFNDFKFGDYAENSIDAFGDAYEYLMKMYASNAGKSGGEFFTPQEVSELLAEITTIGKTVVNKVYDPACGSGSLLLKFAKILGKDNVKQGFYGQEINLTTFNLCRINMFLHDIGFEKFDIKNADTLISPQHWDDVPFDAIVSNPPYSIKWIGDSDPTLINDERFAPAGVLAPKSKADLAFTMHILSCLSIEGVAAVIQFPGTLYRGAAEKKIRKYLIDQNYIETVIQLPENLFFGTSIATCILVLKKCKVDNKTQFIDASEEFDKVGTKNMLKKENRTKILDAIKDRSSIKHFAELVDNNVVAENDYELSVTKYVKPKDNESPLDINCLNKEIKEIVNRQNNLRTEIDKIVKDLQKINEK